MRRTLALTLSLVVVATASSPVLAGSAPAPDRSALVHAVGGCELFPADNPWNTRIDRRPVWRWSSAIVRKQAAGHDLHLDLGTTEDHYGIPVNVVAWRAASAARWDLSSNRLRPAGWTSADAAGLQILPGLLSYEEAASGRITHALRFTLPSARSAYTWPARHCGPSGNTARDLPAYGLRFRLARSFPARRYTGVARTIVVAMKTYGLVHSDQGSSMYVTGTSDPRWADALDQFRARPVDGKSLEVVKPWRRVVTC